MNTLDPQQDSLPFEPAQAVRWSRDQIEFVVDSLRESLRWGDRPNMAAILEVLGGRIHSVKPDDARLASPASAKVSRSNATVLVRGLGDFDVFISESSDHRLTRYWLAHELAHYLLHSTDWSAAQPRPGSLKIMAHGIIGVEGDEGSQRAELEANQFARALLIPRAAVARYVEVGVGSAALVSMRFDVPKDVAKFRLQDLAIDA